MRQRLRRGPSSSRVLTVAVIASAALVLSGCGAVQYLSPGVGATHSTSASPTATPTPEPEARLTAASPGSLAVGAVPALRSVAYARAGSVPIEGTWVYIDGDTAFNTAVDGAVLGQLDGMRSAGAGAFAATLGTDAVHAVTAVDGSAGARIRTEVVAAAGSRVGVRILARDRTDGADRVLTTVFTDVSTGETTDGSGLVQPGAVGTLAGIVQRTAARTPGAAGTAAVALTPAELRDTTLDADGALVVPVPGSTTSTVTVAPRTAAPLLTSFGAALQRDQLARVAPVVPPAGSMPHVPCALVACVALTYDDGPADPTTTELLGILQSEGVPGTFFEEGQNVAAHPALTSAVLRAGFPVENHTYDHPDLTKIGSDAVVGEVQRTDQAFTAAGFGTPPLFRAPYGATDPVVLAAVGKPLIHWSVDSFDWKSKDPNQFVPLVLRKIKPGGVVLMHDVYQSTIDGQRPLIDQLRAKGYTLVTVPQLFEGIPLLAHTRYACRGTYTPDTGVPCSGR